MCIFVCSLQAMMGEWVLHEEGASQASPVNNDILDHVLSRLQSMIVRPSGSTPPPLFPRFTIRACILGKTHSGKTSCLARISNGKSWCFIIIRAVLEWKVLWHIKTILTTFFDFVVCWSLGISPWHPCALSQRFDSGCSISLSEGKTGCEWKPRSVTGQENLLLVLCECLEVENQQIWSYFSTKPLLEQFVICFTELQTFYLLHLHCLIPMLGLTMYLPCSEEPGEKWSSDRRYWAASERWRDGDVLLSRIRFVRILDSF